MKGHHPEVSEACSGGQQGKQGTEHSFLGALRGKDLVSSGDLGAEQTQALLRAAVELKSRGGAGEQFLPLQGQCVALVFEKPSTRTRVSFETGIVQLGGHPIYLSQADIGLGTRESVPDIAHNLSRMVQAIVARTVAHDTVVQLAEHASVPVINALSDREHPCQALADFLTILERAGSLAGFPLAWVGDGNNVCHSVLLTGAKLGVDIRVATPPGYAPDAGIVRQAKQDAARHGGAIHLTYEPMEAVRGAKAVYTDVWTSMGQEQEREDRLKTFARYQVNANLMAAATPGAFVLHCLPAHRGEEITREVLEGPQSAVFDQAENRLHAQKALVAMMMG